MSQTAADYDRIRDRELTAHLDEKFRDETPEELEARQHKEEAERIDAALAEVLDIAKYLRGGTLDYDAAAGTVIEYLPEITRGLLKLQGRAA